MVTCDCGSTDLRQTDAGPNWTEYECQDCGSLFFHDQPTPERIP